MNKLKFVINTEKIAWHLLFVSFMGLTACSGIPKKQLSTELTTDQQQEADVVKEFEEPELDPNLPNVELDQTTLEQLLIQNFASAQGDWLQSSSNALLAAKSSNDYRLAQTATLLALRGNDYVQALEGARLWFELEPDSENAKNILLISQIGAGHGKEAIEFIETHYGDKELDETIKEVADLVVRQRNSSSGLLVMTHFMEKYPQSAQAHLSGAYVAGVFKEYEIAQGWLDLAIELKPGWDLAAQMKADILLSEGNLEERSVFLEEYAKSHPESVRINTNYAADLARQERYQEAYTTMQGVVERDPENSAALYYTGALAGQLEETEQAKQYFRQALNADPKNDDARWSLGRLAAAEEQYITAEKYFNAITVQESFVDAQIQVANARYHLSGIESALKVLELLEPMTQGEYVNIALARHNLFLRDYKYEEALGFINEVLLSLPNDLDLLYARALVAAELKKTDIAEADFRAILDQQPDNADTLNALGYTLADQTQRYDEARVLIAKALEFRPDAAHILDSMGWVLYRLEDYVQSIEFLQKAYDAAPEVEIAAHLGEVLWVSGDQQQAKAIWQEGVNEEEDNPVLKETLERFNVSLNSVKAN